MLEGGRIRYEGTAKELTEQPDLLRSAYLLRGKEAAPALDSVAIGRRPAAGLRARARRAR